MAALSVIVILAIGFGSITGLCLVSGLALFTGDRDGTLTVDFMRYKEGYVEFGLFLLAIVGYPFLIFQTLKRLANIDKAKSYPVIIGDKRTNYDV